MAAIAGLNADIYITSGSALAFSQEATTADTTETRFTISDPTKRYWNPDASFTVETSPDGVTWTVVTSGYSLEYAGGVVVFDTVQTGLQVRVSGEYFAASQLGEAKEWSLDLNTDTEDTTVFGSNWKTFTSLLKGAIASLSRWWIDGYFLENIGSRLALVLYTDKANDKRYEGYARIKGDSVKVAVAGLVEEELNFEFTGPVYYHE